MLPQQSHRIQVVSLDVIHQEKRILVRHWWQALPVEGKEEGDDLVLRIAFVPRTHDIVRLQRPAHLKRPSTVASVNASEAVRLDSNGERCIAHHLERLVRFDCPPDSHLGDLSVKFTIGLTQRRRGWPLCSWRAVRGYCQR